ncbi:M23 family metallopeptidase [Desulfonatronovibrio magnus]|uniref:M23 family metallopeptidase n=1 Tax=Desulfonatronovibrio magnus TaxID=698827 RepID=UPI0005EB1612|nr:M23 family metallopeptidase [Desulfonatronovibrio magnus]
MKRALLAILVFFLWVLPVKAATINLPERVGQGEPFWVEFVSDKNPDSLTVQWLEKTVEYPVDFNGTQSILLSAGLDHKGKYPLSISFDFGDEQIVEEFNVYISAKDYPEQRLTLPESMVTPPQEVIDRIVREREKTVNALNTLSPERYWTTDFVRPASGSVSSPFGVRRFLNDEPRAPHRGVDLRGPEGTPVKAMETGRVILTGDFYFGGKTVILDHGLGFVTVYMHLSEINVNKGEYISKGDLVGLVGMTGRATGPHLHLGVYVLGQAVDPMLLLE